MKPLRIGLLGIGTVGGGTFDVLAQRRRNFIVAPVVRSRSLTSPDKNTALANQVVARAARW